MAPPSQNLNLDVAAISGICGSISIACWLFVFCPQIYENFRRGSTEGVSEKFIIIWAVGDVFNLLGGVIQGVLPTMIILAIYYLVVDVVFLGQCFYYRGVTSHDAAEPLPKPSNEAEASETTGLITPRPGPGRRSSAISGEHLSPAVPLLGASNPPPKNLKPKSKLKDALFKVTTVFVVCIAGVFGWWVSEQSSSGGSSTPDQDSGSDLEFSLWGQIFGYICAGFYIASRFPQLRHIFERKSTEGTALLFVLFSCLGNLTYVLSIFAYEVHCQGKDGKCRHGESGSLYRRYIAINASWLAGSVVTLLLDLLALSQFYRYREKAPREEQEESIIDGNGREPERDRPLLERGDSSYQ